MSTILVPVSIGELFDKFSILQIKIERISDKNKRKECEMELQHLNVLFVEYFDQNKLLFQRLKIVNEKLWKIEDEIRLKERYKEFDESFIKLARSVYIVNDERFRIKHEINIFFGSKIIEVKSYEEY